MAQKILTYRTLQWSLSNGLRQRYPTFDRTMLESTKTLLLAAKRHQLEQLAKEHCPPGVLYPVDQIDAFILLVFRITLDGFSTAQVEQAAAAIDLQIQAQITPP